MSLRKDYFDLQWRFARHYAEAAHLPLDQAIARCTNLRRRMNLWGPAGASRWEAFLSAIRASGPDHPPGFHLYMAFQEGEPPPPRPRTFGCFSHDSPDPSGVLRIHFMPPPGIDRSPLAFASMAERMDELRALFRQVRQEHPTRGRYGASRGSTTSRPIGGCFRRSTAIPRAPQTFPCT
ncbi:hypothetical protein [Paracidovorax avenae]|uniref:hypothetical protein n=1 Tax=Paracidovorax avenae TaxID=80867 RepID=UPI001CEF77B3|nr:hypothetical protein [Paracidovorax avenae]